MPVAWTLTSEFAVRLSLFLKAVPDTPTNLGTPTEFSKTQAGVLESTGIL